MRNSPTRFRALLAWGAACLVMLVSACSSPPPPAAATRTPTAKVLSIPTVTPTREKTATPTVPATPVPIRLPSPTPFSHTLIAGDTLLGIALLYGVEVDDLLAANPGIDPGFLTIGASIVIPLGEGGLTSAPTPEPLPVDLLQPVCYASAAGDLTCFSMVANGFAGGIEGVTVQISLVDEVGNILIDQLASPPLNLIPANSLLPAVTTFRAPLPDPVFAASTLVTAFPLAEGSSRYIPLDGGDPQITISENGMSAHVEGSLRLPPRNPAAGQIRAAGIAYDELGNPAGYRIWEANQVLDPGGSLPYAIDLYSLGPSITRVEVFFEGRPLTAGATQPAP